jgi:hypothetical protein
MRDPRYYARALLVCHAGVTAICIAIGCVVYYYCGSYVASPALGSAGATVKKVCYGFALPGLIVTTTLVIHVSVHHREGKGPNANRLVGGGEVYFCPHPPRLQALDF